MITIGSNLKELSVYKYEYLFVHYGDYSTSKIAIPRAAPMIIHEWSSTQLTIES